MQSYRSEVEDFVACNNREIEDNNREIENLNAESGDFQRIIKNAINDYEDSVSSFNQRVR